MSILGTLSALFLSSFCAGDSITRLLLKKRRKSGKKSKKEKKKKIESLWVHIHWQSNYMQMKLRTNDQLLECASDGEIYSWFAFTLKVISPNSPLGTGNFILLASIFSSLSLSRLLFCLLFFSCKLCLLLRASLNCFFQLFFRFSCENHSVQFVWQKVSPLSWHIKVQWLVTLWVFREG